MAELRRRGGNTLGVGKDRTNRLPERVRRDPVIPKGFSDLSPLLAKAIWITNRSHARGKDHAKVVGSRSVGLTLAEDFNGEGRREVPLP